MKKRVKLFLNSILDSILSNNMIINLLFSLCLVLIPIFIFDVFVELRSHNYNNPLIQKSIHFHVPIPSISQYVKKLFISEDFKNILKYIKKSFASENFKNILKSFFILFFYLIIVVIIERRKQKIMDEKRHYLETIKSRDFKGFSEEAMLKYYGNILITENKINFPCFCFESKDINKSAVNLEDFDNEFLYADNCEFENFKVEDHQDYKNAKLYKAYKNIIEDNIKHPDRPGYLLKNIEIENDKIDKINVGIGTFAENAYTSHVLEYELYKAFEYYRKQNYKNEDKIWKKVKRRLKLRNKIHGISDPNDIPNNFDWKTKLLSGDGRKSMLSIQMLVIIYNEKTKQYEILLIKRADNVLACPGAYQIVPAGYMEVFDNTDYSPQDLNDNMKFSVALFREYLEELFNRDGLDGTGRASLKTLIDEDPEIKKIKKVVSKKASFYFLGGVLDLRYLLYHFSFVLFIEDASSLDTRFFGNFEARRGEVIICPICEFKQSRYWDNLLPSSAGMWHLFKKTKIFKEIEGIAEK